MFVLTDGRFLVYLVKVNENPDVIYYIDPDTEPKFKPEYLKKDFVISYEHVMIVDWKLLHGDLDDDLFQKLIKIEYITENHTKEEGYVMYLRDKSTHPLFLSSMLKLREIMDAIKIARQKKLY
jgi:hypothetical protein